MTDKEQPQPKDVKEDVKPAAAPVDGNPTINPLRDINAGGKPPLAPIFETPKPKPKPAEPAKPEPEPSEPPPSPPPKGDD